MTASWRLDVLAQSPGSGPGFANCTERSFSCLCFWVWLFFQNHGSKYSRWQRSNGIISTLTNSVSEVFPLSSNVYGHPPNKIL